MLSLRSVASFVSRQKKNKIKESLCLSGCSEFCRRDYFLIVYPTRFYLFCKCFKCVCPVILVSLNKKLDFFY
jgi:hypothetical protein